MEIGRLIMDAKERLFQVSIEAACSLTKLYEGFKARLCEPDVEVIIGHGRYLRKRGLSQEEAHMLLLNDMKENMRILRGLLSDDILTAMGSARQVALLATVQHLDLLQIPGVIDALNAQRWGEAADRIMTADWAPHQKSYAKVIGHTLFLGSLDPFTGPLN